MCNNFATDTVNNKIPNMAIVAIAGKPERYFKILRFSCSTNQLSNIKSGYVTLNLTILFSLRYIHIFKNTQYPIYNRNCFSPESGYEVSASI